ncbi:SpaA isopeptide-forming pilin-related protein [Corynebacterium sp. ES2715-CONJ3]|uniref:SpaA isopeptide-forming pilin-related protein n=1 Tax=Corynebacterium sp. ES2715-CONJ3 TaxID=2974028 RepID=UPI002168DCCF|nr:SpaA isopeptide-forming pilin-related protein [Corynebacterium sp. ES2715-CONJ3]MCS4491312.1 SpaA isopeptide-forming pilin-related protein [Corynebacterium sp. ES2715-CONJ3]
MKNSLSRYGKALFASMLATGLLVTVAPFAQSAEEMAGTSEIAQLSDASIEGEPTLVEQESLAENSENSEGNLSADFTSRTISADEESGLVVRTLEGVITNVPELQSSPDFLLIQKLGNNDPVKEIISASFGDTEASGDIFELASDELENSFGQSQEDAKFGQVLRLYLDSTNADTPTEIQRGDKFSITYTVMGVEEDAHWKLLTSEFLDSVLGDSPLKLSSVSAGPKIEYTVTDLKTGEYKGRKYTERRVSGRIVDDSGIRPSFPRVFFEFQGVPTDFWEAQSRDRGPQEKPSDPKIGGIRVHIYEEATGNVVDSRNHYIYTPMQYERSFDLNAADRDHVIVQLVDDQRRATNGRLSGKNFEFVYRDFGPKVRSTWKILPTDSGYTEAAAAPKPGGFDRVSAGRDAYQQFIERDHLPSELLGARDEDGEVEDYRYPVKEVAPRSDNPSFPGPNAGSDNVTTDGGISRKIINNPGWCSPFHRKPDHTTINFSQERQNNSRGGECQVLNYGEQGRFYSRENVQTATYNRNTRLSYRSQEFTIGGTKGGVLYGVNFGVFEPLRYARMGPPDLGIVRGDARKALNFQILDILDTTDWVVTTDLKNNYHGSYILTPHPVKSRGKYIDDPRNKMGIRVSTSQRGKSKVEFLSPEGIKFFIDSGRGSSAVDVTRLGLKIPPNTPMKISYGTNERESVLRNDLKFARNGFLVPYWGNVSQPDPTELEVSKAPIASESNGVDIFTYDLTVRNDKAEAGKRNISREYLLYDTPDFAKAEKIIKVVQVKSGGETPLVKSGDGKGYVIPGENGNTHVIEAGATQTFRIKVYTELDAEALNPSRLACQPKPTPGDGAYNKARIEYGQSEVAEAEACIDIVNLKIAPPRVSKEVYGNRITWRPNGNEEPFYQATYTVTVDNKAEENQTNGPVVSTDREIYVDRELTVVDSLGFSEDVDVFRVVLIDLDTNKNTVISPVNGPLVLQHGDVPGKVKVRAGETLEFRVLVQFRFQPKLISGVSPNSLKCAAGGRGNGGFNKVTVAKEGAGTTEDLTAEACIDLPLPPLVVKEVFRGPRENASGKLEIEYRVKVTNPNDSTKIGKLKLVDQPRFSPSARNISVGIREDSASSYQMRPADNHKLPSDVFDLDSGASKTFFVIAEFDKPQLQDKASTTLICDPQNGGGHGLFNEATVSIGSRLIARDDACADIPAPEDPLTSLVLQKVDTSTAIIPLEKDWQFSVYRANDSWEIQGDAINFTQTNAGDNTRQTENIIGLGKYILIETKAPQGYQLLAQPVELEVFLDGNQLKVRQPQGRVNPAAEVTEPNIIKVADVTTGELPRSGGFGVFWLLIAGAGLLGGAWWFNRRKN